MAIPYSIDVKDPEALEMLLQHDATYSGIHDNLEVDGCSCRTNTVAVAIAAPTEVPKAFAPDGGVCFSCGGLTRRTGSCTTCTECGTSSGCG